MKCSKHPKYKAIRKPTANCSKCHEMFAETLRQRELKEAIPVVEKENSIKASVLKKEQDDKEIVEALKFYRLYNKLLRMDSSWREVKITKERFDDGDWNIESGVWVDNGYGGNLSKVSATGRTFNEAIEIFLKKVEEKDSRCKASYM